MTTETSLETFDVVVVGGGPAGATAATDLARRGHKVMLLDRMGRIKPCGGAIPPRAIRDFEIPDEILVARITSARMVSPKNECVDMPIEKGFVGMVDRKFFDPWLRERAAKAGAELRGGTFEKIDRDADGTAVIRYRARDDAEDAPLQAVRGRAVIAADGARSQLGKQAVPGFDKMRYVAAYHEIIAMPEKLPDSYDHARCDVYYQGRISPDFYGWIFPHGDTISIGTGSAIKGFQLRSATALLRKVSGLEDAKTLRCEGAPIPMEPLKCWDNGRDIVLAGDAAGVVAPASGEGIYYALLGGRLAADAVTEFLKTGKASALGQARKRFMKAHGRVFFILGIMQRFWYSSDRLREHFVSICKDKDVQKLTWESYMNKELVRKKPMAHLRIFFKDLAHLAGFLKP